jgi:hypothetical protein
MPESGIATAGVVRLSVERKLAGIESGASRRPDPHRDDDCSYDDLLGVVRAEMGQPPE